jgi:hypothetical protein
MSKIALKSNPLGTGTFTIESPNSNNDRTVVLPDGNGDVVLTTATQTLTNKSISAAQINSGTLGVARGGTGASTLTANNVLLGNGTSALQAVAPGTSGNVLTSNGTTWTSAAPGGGAAVVNTFNSNGTWTKPATGSMARIQVWGGGGGGSRRTDTGSTPGGGGGGYNEVTVPLSTLGSTVSVTIGGGGAGRTGSAGAGGGGGLTTFGALLGASGGVGAPTFETQTSGGSPSKEGTTTFVPGTIFTGGTGIPGNGGNATYGGGAGGGAQSVSNTNGGGSLFGGDGGNGGRSTSNINGEFPSGGGGSRNNNLDGGNGAAGRVIVTVW